MGASGKLSHVIKVAQQAVGPGPDSDPGLPASDPVVFTAPDLHVGICRGQESCPTGHTWAQPPICGHPLERPRIRLLSFTGTSCRGKGSVKLVRSPSLQGQSHINAGGMGVKLCRGQGKPTRAWQCFTNLNQVALMNFSPTGHLPFSRKGQGPVLRAAGSLQA